MIFTLKILRQHWIKDNLEDDPEDLCSHGEVLLKIGKELLSDKSSGSWTLSVASLFLMRTLLQDYTINDFGNQLLPCCGHTLFFDEKTNQLSILGCPNGIDWSVKHLNNTVELTTQKEQKTIISYKVYYNTIMSFVEEVASFYGNPKDKTPINDGFTDQAYHQFWKEWNNLKNRLTNKDNKQ